jgi:myo-inositol-1(or 4)-monophosphatase
MNLKNICLKACEEINLISNFLNKELGKVATNAIEIKEKNHLVSYVDKQSEQQLIEKLSKIVPEAGFLAEEATVAYEAKDWQWIIDPLDGTTNFLHSLPFFSISVALQYQGKTVLGIVHAVMQNETFYSFGQHEAYLNKKRINVSPTLHLGDALLATGFPYYDFDHIDAYLAMIKPLMLQTRGLRRFGSAAMDLAYVACGRFDGYFEYSLAPWDVAAGAFIVQQAGGLVSDFSAGNDFVFGKEIVAANPNIYNYLIESTKIFFNK